MVKTEIESPVKLCDGRGVLALQELPLLRVRPEMIAEVGQGEMGVSNPNAACPYLATCGVGPCVALVGWDSDRKTGFIAHIDTAGSFDKGLGDLLYHLRIGHGSKKFDGEVLLMSPNSLGDSEKVTRIKEMIAHSFGDVKFSLRHEITGPDAVSRIALDTRSGGLFTYEPRPLQMDSFDSPQLSSAVFGRVLGSEGMKVTYSAANDARG